MFAIQASVTVRTCVSFRSVMLPPSFTCIPLDKDLQSAYSASQCLRRVVLVALVRVQSRNGAVMPRTQWLPICVLSFLLVW